MNLSIFSAGSFRSNIYFTTPFYMLATVIMYISCSLSNIPYEEKKDSQSLNLNEIQQPEVKNKINQTPTTVASSKKIELSDLKLNQHLDPYKDQILLSNHEIQVVFKTGNSEPQMDGWLDIIEAIFLKSKDNWSHLNKLTKIQIKKNSFSNHNYIPIALDFGRDAQNFGYLTLIYADNNGKGIKTTMTWNLHPYEPILTLTTNNLISTKIKDSSQLWQLRILNTSGLKESKDNLTNLSYITGIEQSYPMVVSSYNSLRVIDQNNNFTLVPSTDGTLGLNGYYFMFGHWFSDLKEDYFSALNDCRSQHEKDDFEKYSNEDKLILLQSCMNTIIGFRK